MALKDNIKHFRDVDEYSTTITKGDMDDNLDLLADNIDKKAFEYTSDDTAIVATKDEKSFSTKVDGIVAGAGIMFDISNLSFRVGATNETKEDRGFVSFAYGTDNEAKGDTSTAIGAGNSANSDGAIAMGIGNSVSDSTNGVAIGTANAIQGEISLAVGNGNSVQGEVSYAIGDDNKINSSYSIAFGVSNESNDDYSTALGCYCKANGNSSTALGYNSKANGGSSTALGYNSEANAADSIAIGSFAIANGDYSIAMGYYSEASGYSAAIGYYTKALGDYSTAIGYHTQSNGSSSTAMGYYSEANGDYSSAFGYFTKANGAYSFAGGNWGVSADGESSFAFGYNVQASEDYSVCFGMASKNIQKMSLAIGDNIVLKGVYVDKYSTSDDTETTMLNPLKLKLKSAYLVRQKLIALKDDYATKWIAEIEHTIIVDGDGNVTINTTQNDIVKDDDNWSISFEAISDAENPLVNTKIKGVADTNINWGIFGEVNELLG